MPIRYPIAFRSTARPSVCSAWRLKVPKIERLTHPKPYIVPKPDALPKPFVCFSLICSSRNPISCRKLGVLPKPFACFCLICSSRNPCFSWNLELLGISVKPRLAFVISETCKPFSSLSAFSPFGATKAFCECEKLNINICLHIPQRSGGCSRQQGQGGRGVFIKTG